MNRKLENKIKNLFDLEEINYETMKALKNAFNQASRKSKNIYRLTENEKIVFRERVFEDKTLEEIGEELSLTKSRIKIIENRVLEKISKKGVEYIKNKM